MRSTMIGIVSVCTCAALAAACAKHEVRADQHAAPYGPQDAQAIATFTKGVIALDSDSTADATKLAALLAQAGGPDFAGFGKYATAADGAARFAVLATATDLACNKTVGDKAMAAPITDRWRLLADGCGAAYYGLAAGQEAMLSETWFVAQRTGAWIAAEHGRAAGHADVLAPLDAALKDFTLALPVPAAGLAASDQSGWSVAWSYVVIGADTVSVAIAPHARFAADGAHLADVPGGAYPGVKTSVDELAKTQHELVAASLNGQPGAHAALAPPDDARPAPPADGRMEKGPPPSDDAPVTAGVPPDAPLLVAPATLPAARVFEILRALPAAGAWLAVVDHDGQTAAHHAGFGVLSQKNADGGYGVHHSPSQAHIEVDTTGFTAWFDFGASAEKIDAAALAAWLDEHATSIHEREDLVGVGVRPDARGTATVAQLVAMLDVIAAHGHPVVVVDLETDSPSRYGTIGHGSGTGTGGGCGGSGYGIGGCGHRGSVKAPQARLGNIQSTGDLDKLIIRKYVRMHLAQLEYCYEKQLIAKPTLAGTTTVVFAIDANGKVTSSSATGLGDQDTETCVAGVVKAIQFPKPTSGAVQVSYPITFSLPK